jgi:hypothetical protein
MAGAMVKQSFDAAEQTLKRAVAAPGRVAGAVANVAKAAAGGSATAARKRSARTVAAKRSR